MRFFRRMDDLVPAERRGLAESFTANFTNERSSTGVNWHMSGEVIVCIEHFTTLRTGKCLLLCEGSCRSGIARVRGIGRTIQITGRRR